MLVSISGIDGAGKTTVIAAIRRSLAQNGSEAKVAWCGYDPFLTQPAIFAYRVFRRIFNRDGVQELSYRAAKRSFVRRSWIRRAYFWIVMLDYVLSTTIKLRVASRRDPLVICDRYVPDVAVELALDLGLQPPGAMAIFNSLFRWLPRPAHMFLIDVPAAVAIRRKQDIFSIGELAVRRNFYVQLAETSEFSMLNGELAPGVVAQRVLSDLRGL